MPEELNVLHNPGDNADAVPQRQPRLWMAAGVVLFFGLAGYLIFGSNPWLERPDRLPASFQLDLQEQLTVEPDLLRYRMLDQFALPLTEVRALATGPNDTIYVADGQSVHILNHQGDAEREIAISGARTCLAVGGTDHVEPGRMYVATPGGIEVFDTGGERVATWPQPNDQAVLTSIALARQDVFLADAGNRVVWRYSMAGERLGQIGRPDPAREVPGFIIPGRHFDVVVAAEDLLYVVNPGKLQVVTFTFAGDIGTAWGRADTSIRGFFGCCNPTHLALLPDGRFVTSEKGIPRVKVYSPTGTLEAVVAAPQQLGISPQSIRDPRLSGQQAAVEIATDSRGRVLVLDPQSKSIRVFVSKDLENNDE